MNKNYLCNLEIFTFHYTDSVQTLINEDITIISKYHILHFATTKGGYTMVENSLPCGSVRSKLQVRVSFQVILIKSGS